MSTNKNALLRYQVLDRCFRNPGRKYFIEDLVNECNNALLEFDETTDGIQKRQIQYDIRFMESEQGWSIPLERMKDGNRVYYRYSDLSFSINNQPLSQIEALKLTEALSIFSRFGGSQQFNWVNELIPQLKQTFGLSTDNQEVMSFDSNEYLKGIEFLGDLFSAILYNKVLEINYKPFSSEDAKPMIVHPYYLKQFNNRWFLFGLSQDYRKISNYALDRIVNILEIRTPFISSDIDFNEYFEDIIGVTRPEGVPIQKVILGFNCEIAPYIVTKPIHGSQRKLRFDDNGLEISIEVIPNYELESLILSFGEKVTVISPDSVKTAVMRRIKKMVSNYES